MCFCQCSSCHVHACMMWCVPYRPSEAYAVLQSPEQVLVGRLHNLKACSSLHILDPAVGLTLCGTSTASDIQTFTRQHMSTKDWWCLFCCLHQAGLGTRHVLVYQCQGRCATRLLRTCGSIMRGQRLALLMMIAFSTLTVSDGRPAIVQARTCTGSASVFVRLACGLCGKPTSSSFAHQSANKALR